MKARKEIFQVFQHGEDRCEMDGHQRGDTDSTTTCHPSLAQSYFLFYTSEAFLLGAFPVVLMKICRIECRLADFFFPQFCFQKLKVSLLNFKLWFGAKNT